MSAATVVAELTKVDALPSSKVEPSVGDGDIDAHTGNDALGMCGHIVRAFEDVTVVRHIFRYKPVVNSFHVTPHVRVPVLADTQCAAGMLHKEIEQSCFRQLWQMPEHFVGYQMEATRPGLQLKFYLLYHQLYSFS